MYRDVKKKLLSVALCICMIMGMVQVVPKAKAATTTTPISVSVKGGGGSNASHEITVTVDDDIIYDGKPHTATLDRIDPELPNADCDLYYEKDGVRVDAPVDAGVYKIYVEDNTYAFSGSVGTLTIQKAKIANVNFSVDTGKIVLIKDANGTVPTLLNSNIVTDNNKIIKIPYDSQKGYTIASIKTSGTQECLVTFSDAVKNNYSNAEELNNVKVSCTAAYDIGSYSSKYQIVFKNGGTYEANGQQTYSGNKFQPTVAIKDISNDLIIGEIYKNCIFYTHRRNGGDPSNDVKSAGDYAVKVDFGSASQGEYETIGTELFSESCETADYHVTGKPVNDLFVFVTQNGERFDINPAHPGHKSLVMDWQEGNAVVPNISSVETQDGAISKDLYSVTCTDNTAVGIAKMSIKVATDVYEGVLEIPYSIASDLRFQTIKFKRGDDGYTAEDNIELPYTGTVQIPFQNDSSSLNDGIKIINANVNETILIENAHYKVYYSYQKGTDSSTGAPIFSDGLTREQAMSSSESENMKKPGLKKISIIGQGMYEGHNLEKTYKILEVDMDQATLSIPSEGNIYYDGQKKTPAVEVTYNGIPLNEGTDFEVNYTNNINVEDEATVTITAKEDSGFVGSLSKRFNIKPVNIRDARINNAPFTYNAKPVDPVIVIDDVKYGTGYYFELKKGVHYAIVDDEGNTLQDPLPSDASDRDYTLHIKNLKTDEGNITGEGKDVSFQINKKNIEDGDIEFALEGVNGDNREIEWNGGETKPTIRTSLREGDYHAEYVCGIDKIGVVTGASVTISGDEKNYTGTITLRYTITPRKLDSSPCEITTELTGSVGAYQIRMKVVDPNVTLGSKNLVKDDDYEIVSVFYSDGISENPVEILTPDYTPFSDGITVKKAGKYSITIKGKAGSRYSDIEGHTLTAEQTCGTDLSANGSYVSIGTGEFGLSFSHVYNGTVITPAAFTLRKSDGTQLESNESCFTVKYLKQSKTNTSEYEYVDKPTAIGTYYLVATGNPAEGYFGTTQRTAKKTDEYSAYYMITAPVWSVTNPITVELVSSGSITYDPSGTEKPQVVASYGGISLTEGTDFEVVWPKDQAGYNVITIRGIGNYKYEKGEVKNEVSKTYYVNPINIATNEKITEVTPPAEYGKDDIGFKLYFNGKELDPETSYTYQVSGSAIRDDVNNTYKTTYVVKGKQPNFTGTREVSVEVYRNVITSVTEVDGKDALEGKEPGFYVVWNQGEMVIPASQAAIDEQRRDPVKPELFKIYHKKENGTVVTLKKGSSETDPDGDYYIAGYGANNVAGYYENNKVIIQGINRYDGRPELKFCLYTDISGAKTTDTSFIKSSGSKITKARWNAAVASAEGAGSLIQLSNIDQSGGQISPDEYTIVWDTRLYNPDGTMADPDAEDDYVVRIIGGETAPHFYRNELSIKFSIVNDFSEVDVIAEKVVYTATPAALGRNDLRVTLGNAELIRDVDYEVLEDTYRDNRAIGKASVTLKGKGNYEGTKTITFDVVYPFNNMVFFIEKGNNEFVNSSESNLEYVYTGQQITPAVHAFCSCDIPANVDKTDYDAVRQSTNEVPISLYEVEYGSNTESGTNKGSIAIRGAYFTGQDAWNKLFTIQKASIKRYPQGEVIYTIGNGTGELSLTYTGKPFTEEELGIRLSYKGRLLTSGDQYDYVIGGIDKAIDVTNNGVITVHGVNNFQDTYDLNIQVGEKSLADSDVTGDDIELVYTGDSIDKAVKEKVKLVHGGYRNLILDTDYEVEGYYSDIWCRNQILDSDRNPIAPSAQGTYYVKLKGLGNYTDDKVLEVVVGKREMSDTSGFKITFASSIDCPLDSTGKPICVYNGSEHKPEIIVTYGQTRLEKGTDYSVTYSNNKNASTEGAPATITVTALPNSNYDGSVTENFVIQPKNIAKLSTDTNTMIYSQVAENYAFTGQSVEPVMVIQDMETGLTLMEDPSTTDLTPGTDYKINYESEYKALEVEAGAPLHSYAGQVTMTIVGQGNYTGTQQFTYYIGEDISKSYTLINGMLAVSTEYNGLVQAPNESDITVRWEADTDLTDESGAKRYDIAYYKDGFEKSNLVTRDQFVNAGTYYIAVCGVPSKGTYAKSSINNSCVYTINPRSIAPAYILVSGYDGTYYYTGQPIQPKGLSVEDTDLPISSDPNDPQRRSVKLTNGLDYELSYLNNVSAGKASIIVTGKGNYTGSRAAYFNIISSNANGNNTWDGSSEGTGSISNGTTTIAASDIILGYDNSAYDCMMYNGYERIPTVNIAGISNNEFIITASNNIRPGIATLTITGRGNNFTGTIIKNYKIKADLSYYGTIATIADQVYSGYQITPSVTLTCGGNLLNQGSDYTVTYLNNTNVGKATVMATATSDSYYIGSATGTFNISNTAGGMEITGYGCAYTYTGYPIAPDVVVTMNGRVLNRGTDYTVTYSNNTNVGTATMTVTGIGSFSGTKTITYAIEAKNIENCLTTAVTSYQYTGSTYTPSVTVTDSTNGKTLVAGTDYTITYSNNTNPGTASITVTALSKNYTGSKVIPFKITSAAVSGLRTSTIKNNSIKLAWSAQDYADGYQICNSSNRVVATTNKNSYTVSGLTSCTTYKFKVRSYVENADGSVSYGNFSTAVSAKTLLNTPKLTAKSTSKGKVTLTWTKVSKATGYEIFYSTKKNGIYTRLKTVSKSSARKYVDSGLASGEKYYYTIRAYRTSNGVKTYSNYNTIKSVKVK